MIAASVAMVVMAGLFVLFGVLGLADARACDGGCAGCRGPCDRGDEACAYRGAPTLHDNDEVIP